MPENQAAVIAQHREYAFQSAVQFLISSAIVWIVLYLTCVIGLFKMYEKAGVERWKAFIPFYNTYLLFKLCWKRKWFWIAIIGILFIVIFGNLRVGKPLSIVFAVFVVIAFIMLFAIRCFLGLKVAQSYEKTLAWGIGLIFLPFLFYIFLGWGSSKYVGVIEGLKIEIKNRKLKPTKRKKVSPKARVASASAVKNQPEKPKAPTSKSTQTKGSSNKIDF